MKRACVYFESRGNVALVEETVPIPAAGEVLVETEMSAISYGTESKVLSGCASHSTPADSTIPALAGDFCFPMKYGYAAAGRVVATGKDVDEDWLGRRVFAFNPHESHFLARPEWLVAVPDGVSGESSVMLASMETALNLVMDSRPLVGEKVVIFGQGVIGLLVTALLARFPLGALITFDNYRLRRDFSREFGAVASLDPAPPGSIELAKELLGEPGADLACELSGSTAALEQAIALTGFGGRIIAGSWYGDLPAELTLGTHFHRSRLRILSSQVSSIDPALSGRWDRSRRFGLAWDLLPILKPSRLITHRFPVARAPEAYRLLEERPREAIQVVISYR